MNLLNLLKRNIKSKVKWLHKKKNDWIFDRLEAIIINKLLSGQNSKVIEVWNGDTSAAASTKLLELKIDEK